MDSDLTPQILRRAYELWEHEGRPHGRDKAHWFLAEAELNTSVVPMVTETSKPTRKPRTASAPAKSKKR